MKPIEAHPKLAEQVEKAILDEITSGRLGPGSRVIQEHIAKQLGVSRQPVQQALHILRSQGILRDAPGRGLEVVPLDLVYVRNMYDIRSVIEGLACRQAAARQAKQSVKEGEAIIARGKAAAERYDYAQLIECDIEFHNFIYQLSGNPLIPATMETHWRTTQRVMGEVLHGDTEPRDIWKQHEGILKAISAGDTEKAEELARSHISQAAEYMIDRLRQKQAEAGTS